ncbi:hypothetical protein GCK32_014328, partial [Trichostrongylus colubriformis]
FNCKQAIDHTAMHTIGLLLLTLSTMVYVDAENMMCKVCMSFVKVVQPIVEKGGNIMKEKVSTAELSGSPKNGDFQR